MIDIRLGIPEQLSAMKFKPYLFLPVTSDFCFLKNGQKWMDYISTKCLKIQWKKMRKHPSVEKYGDCLKHKLLENVTYYLIDTILVLLDI